MPDRFFYLRKLPAIEAVEKFLTAAREIYPNQSIRLHISTNLKANHLGLENVNPEGHKEITNFIDYLKNNQFISIDNITITTNQYTGITYARNKTYYQVTIRGGNNNDEELNYLCRAASCLHKHFTLIDEPVLQTEALTDFQKNQFSIHETNISHLESLAENLTQNITRQSTIWNESILKLTEGLQAKFNEKETKLNDDFGLKEKKLQEEQDAFLRAKKEFDDRESTVVRRDLLKQIKGLIDEQKTFALSEDTISKRAIINTICSLVLFTTAAAILGLAGCFVYELIKTDKTNLFLLYTASPFVVAFTSMLVFTLRWHGQWFRDHADAEFYNKKFSSDILRASWIAEMFFEWDKANKGLNFPKDLIASFTKGLFDNTLRTSNATHPLEDILKSAEQISKVKIGKGIFEIESAKERKKDLPN